MEIDKQKTKRVYKKKIRGLESYSSILFKIIGFTLLFIAVYYYFDTGNGNGLFYGKTKALAVFPYLSDQELTELTTI